MIVLGLFHTYMSETVYHGVIHLCQHKLIAESLLLSCRKDYKGKTAKKKQKGQVGTVLHQGTAGGQNHHSQSEVRY